MKKIVILGASGSIGTQTLDVVRQHPTALQCLGISVGQNIPWLFEHLKNHHYDLVVVQDEFDAKSLALFYPNQAFAFGSDGLVQLACLEEAEVVVNALVGFAGLVPTLKAIEAKKDIALANKETLVVAGEMVMAKVHEHQVKLRPIDSEHSAILQALQGNDPKAIKRLIVTASGGSFRDKTREELKEVTVEDALRHPNWSMGKKITIDSATLVNKAFEVIEAHHLFNLPYEQIDVIVHKQSIIHSMVEYIDGSIMAQLGTPDMRVPIQYALCGPERLSLDTKGLDFTSLAQLDFKALDSHFYPLFPMIISAAKQGGNRMCVVNAANEAAIQLFLNNEIKYLMIETIVEDCLNHFPYASNLDIEQMVELDAKVKAYVLHQRKELS